MATLEAQYEPDLEAQCEPDVKSRDRLDLERQKVSSGGTVSSPAPTLPSGTKTSLDKSGTVCFVCLDCPLGGQYVARVPCLKSNQPRKVRWWRLVNIAESPQVKVTQRSPVYEPLQPWDTVLEDDRAVYTRMVKVCFQRLGRWRKWLPFYGVVRVTEVLFQFDGRVYRDGRFFGVMTAVDIEKTQQDCKQAIDMDPIPHEYNGWDCCDGYNHANACAYRDKKCLAVAAEEARERVWRVGRHYLLTACAQNPADANGLDTLSGMTQESCIYPTFGTDAVEIPSMNQRWDGETPIRALHFVFGWRMDRIQLELPYLVSIKVFGIGLVWLVVLLSRGAGFDWNVALALAQVVAASVAILMTSLRY